MTAVSRVSLERVDYGITQPTAGAVILQRKAELECERMSEAQVDQLLVSGSRKATNTPST
jgi:hypothetical protein